MFLQAPSSSSASIDAQYTSTDADATSVSMPVDVGDPSVAMQAQPIIETSDINVSESNQLQSDLDTLALPGNDVRSLTVGKVDDGAPEETIIHTIDKSNSLLHDEGDEGDGGGDAVKTTNVTTSPGKECSSADTDRDDRHFSSEGKRLKRCMGFAFL